MTPSARSACTALVTAALVTAALAACATAGPTRGSGPATTGSGPAATGSRPFGTPASSPLRATPWETATGFRCPSPDQRVVVAKVGYGDITGDGVIDAVAALSCTTSTSSNPLEIAAFDGASDPAHPRSLGVLVPFDDPFYVEKVDIAVTATSVDLDGFGLSPDAPMAAGPTLHFTQSFAYRAGRMQAGPRHTG